jgi:hypothetical protein
MCTKSEGITHRNFNCVFDDFIKYNIEIIRYSGVQLISINSGWNDLNLNRK